jgi:DNA modification methylase
MQIELWPIDRVKQYDRNPRNNDAAVGPVAESIRQFGFKVPLLVDRDDVLIAGHTRLRAARQLGLTEVPVIQADDLTPEQVRAFRIADNQLASIATWNLELLPIELSELQAADVDLDVLGFSQDQLGKLLDTTPKDGLIDPDEVPEPPDEAITKPGDLWILGNHRLLCGDSANPEHVDRLLDGQTIQLCNTDPPYNVKVEPRSKAAIAAGNSSFTSYERQPGTVHRNGESAKKLRAKDRPLENDFVSDEEFNRLLHAWFGNIARVLDPGRGFYIWGGYSNCGNYPPVLKAHELYFAQAIIWDKEHPVLSRKDYMGAHEWCQPPDTTVMTPSGSVYMSSLRNNDRVTSYNTNWSNRLRRRGQSVNVATRNYDGTLYGVVAGDRVTHATDGHIFTVRLHARAAEAWCVYLMRRGPWWRVGKCKIAGQWYGFGLKSRLRQEKGEAAWILSTHTDLTSTMCAEQVISVKYGIPTTHWEVYGTPSGIRGPSDIRKIYDQLDLQDIHEGAVKALQAFGRRIEYPLVYAGNMHAKLGRRDPFRVRACNILPGFMSVPMVGPSCVVEYVPVRHLDQQPYVGPVYSLDVPVDRHYVADGIVTHNCFYGWREGAAHQFYGPNNATDLWHVKKINPSKMVHLTEKPVELAVRAMQYSSLPGENVLDLFGGSGSTMIAAEQTNRKGFLMELDPPYCDVIVQRYEAFSGKKAERISTVEPMVTSAA